MKEQQRLGNAASETQALMLYLIMFKTCCVFPLKTGTDFSRQSPQPPQDSTTEGPVTQQAQDTGRSCRPAVILSALAKTYKRLRRTDAPLTSAAESRFQLPQWQALDNCPGEMGRKSGCTQSGGAGNLGDMRWLAMFPVPFSLLG